MHGFEEADTARVALTAHEMHKQVGRVETWPLFILHANSVLDEGPEVPVPDRGVQRYKQKALVLVPFYLKRHLLFPPLFYCHIIALELPLELGQHPADLQAYVPVDTGVSYEENQHQRETQGVHLQVQHGIE